jgi:ribosomal-protein-alanine N-acetyltransferase
MIIPTLETSHLFLRPWTLEDADELFHILQEPDILEYFPPTTFTLEKTQHYINHQLKHWQERGYGHWAVTLKNDSRLVGWDGLEYLPETGENEVAYLLSHQAWGRGFATQAALAAVRYGFETAGLGAIIGLVHPGNIGSIRVLEKCGLTFLDRKVYWGLEMCRYRIEPATRSSDNTLFLNPACPQ